VITDDHGPLSGIWRVGGLALNLNAQFDFNAVGPDGIDHYGYKIGKHGGPREG
jgi:hypothetical protein